MYTVHSQVHRQVSQFLYLFKSQFELCHNNNNNNNNNKNNNNNTLPLSS